MLVSVTDNLEIIIKEIPLSKKIGTEVIEFLIKLIMSWILAIWLNTNEIQLLEFFTAAFKHLGFIWISLLRAIIIFKKKVGAEPQRRDEALADSVETFIMQLFTDC